tara:strand:- start:1123 stop:2025 length:903 start_codon:yes stop_codon:yes gene_type:complete
MTKGYLIKIVVSFTMMLTAVTAQENVDAIEKARQAKEAADKAAAEAAAATSAAIEAAAAKAAKEAREEAKRKKEEEEARKVAEAKAAEEAELDAAAAAAAEEAKRKMAAELGLEVDDPEVEEAVAESTMAEATDATEATEEVVAKEALGWNVGAAASVGLLKGESFSGGLPTGGTVVVTTPFGFKLGPFDYTVSIGFGGYSSSFENSDGSSTDYSPSFAGLGGNLTVADFVFVEGHVGSVGEGSGFRGFAGVTLERLMKNSLNLPFNLLVGSEAFYSTDMLGVGNPSGWAAFGLRLDYGF